MALHHTMINLAPLLGRLGELLRGRRMMFLGLGVAVGPGRALELAPILLVHGT
jgi:hypothetical protein